LLALPAIAHAQEARPTEAIDSAHDSAALISAAQDAKIDPIEGQETPQITINNNFTPTDARDPTNITGIGQVVRDAGGGSVGLCTGTLINRRTIIFAAHCVNNAAATTYGANSGGTGMAVAFETNTRANAAGEPDELVNWLTGGSTGPGRFTTNPAQALYNISQVFWNPASRAAASCTSATSCFIEADIATAVLDTPTRNIPTWTLLFSPLPTPSEINPATGTGYHVTIAGYGQNGTGTSGAVGTDFRRRVAENMLGALTSINDRNIFLFGTAGTPSRPQLLYWLDFDDPARGTATANVRDFNGFRDNALTREGITGPGDSGGPLIIDQAFGTGISTVIGVLSGGSTFFAGQPQSSYGTQAFYQPLFLYWDWILANNPYRYVTALAGNRNWEDAAAWVTELDPAYRILLNGAFVNGIPTQLGGTNVATVPQFGEVCFQTPLNSAAPPAVNECENLTTGAARNNVPNTPTGTSDSPGPLTVAITDDFDGDDAAGGSLSTTDMPLSRGLDGAVESPMADPGYQDGALPAPSLDNGLPGATNFVPNNFDGVRTTGVAARYYDVTLRNAGTITLNSTVTVDNFGIAGAQSGLTIASAGSLTSLVEINHLTGIMNVNGTLTSVGDYFFMSGLLTGTGRVNTPFLTSVLGNFAPATLGTIGTLTIGGNLVMASGSTFAVDIGTAGTSDRLAVVAGSGSTGTANLGGRVLFSLVSGQTIRAGDVYTILTAAGGRTGTFLTPTSISAILVPTLSYTANSVLATITALPYLGVATGSPVQAAFAGLLDRNRGNNSLAPLYVTLDMASAATIQGTLDSWAPRTEALAQSVGIVALENMERFYGSRLGSIDLDETLDGSLTVIGNPLEVVASRTGAQVLPGMQGLANGEATEVQPGALPYGTRGYVAGGYLSGNSDSMTGAVPFGGNDDFNGFFVALGVEAQDGPGTVFGGGVSYTSIDGTTGGVPQGVDGELFQATLYGKADAGGGFVFDARVSGGQLNVKTERAATLGTTNYTLRSIDRSTVYSSELGLARMFGDTLEYGPRLALRAGRVEFSETTETGGPMALTFERDDYTSFQTLAGVVLGGKSGQMRPFASAYYVHEFESQATAIGANFATGVGFNAVFGLNGTDRDWGEIGAGVSFGGPDLEFSVSADTTVFRGDLSNQSYRGTMTMRF